MRKFPSPQHLQFLLDGDPVVTRVTIDSFQVSLLLGNDWTIVAMEKVVWRTDDGSEQIYDIEWRDAPPVTFHKLLDRSLEAVTTDDLTMTMTFEGGCQLTVFTTVGLYESVLIRNSDGKTMVV